MMSEPETFSILVRVQRVITQAAHISVPLSADLMKTDAAGEVILNQQGNTSLDAEKVCARAVELSVHNHQWIDDGIPSVHVHPLQTAPNMEQD
jgi:hypothetical protein